MASSQQNQVLAQVQQALRQALLTQPGRTPLASIGSLGVQVNAGTSTSTASTTSTSVSTS